MLLSWLTFLLKFRGNIVTRYVIPGKSLYRSITSYLSSLKLFQITGIWAMDTLNLFQSHQRRVFFIKKSLSKIWINVLKILKPLDEKNDIRFREKKSLNCPEQSHPTITYSGDKNCHLLMTSLLGENILQNCFWTSKYQRHNHQCLCNPSTQTK